MELSAHQRRAQVEFRRFAEAEVAPHAHRHDREERISPELIEKLAGRGFLAAVLPREWGGQAMEMITFGLLNEELGRACSSLRSLLTVHGMVAYSMLRWGSEAQKKYWLPRMAKGEAIAAFALTEPNVGSDAKSVETVARDSLSGYFLSGQKRWISFGQIADVFLVFARLNGHVAAFLVERGSIGLTLTPRQGMLGLRGSMLAELRLEECHIPKAHLVGRAGFGFSHVAMAALDYGRYSVAWGCVGLAQACLDACISYASGRRQFGAHLKDHQLIQSMVADMIVNIKAARLLCHHAGRLKDAGEPRAFFETSVAKYFASTTAQKAACDAVQIHGANGCSSDYEVERYFRDAKIMEIIEGSNQMQQITIAQHGFQHDTQAL